MVYKRSFGDEESYDLPCKHQRQLDYSNQLTSFAELAPSNDVTHVPISSFGECGSFSKSQGEERVANVTELAVGAAYGFETSVPGGSTCEEYSRSDAAVKLLFSPGFLEAGCSTRTLVQHEEICTSILDYPPPPKLVPIGSDHQATPPQCVALNVLVDNDNWERKLMGTCLLPMPNPEAPLYNIDDVGKGRDDNCKCLERGGPRCIRHHIFEARKKLRDILGNDKFFKMGFHEMGETVSRHWTKEEEQLFQDIVFSNHASLGKNFWAQLSAVFPSRTKMDLVSYYFNVFMLRKRAEHNRLDVPLIPLSLEKMVVKPKAVSSKTKNNQYETRSKLVTPPKRVESEMQSVSQGKEKSKKKKVRDKRIEVSKKKTTALTPTKKVETGKEIVSAGKKGKKRKKVDDKNLNTEVVETDKEIVNACNKEKKRKKVDDKSLSTKVKESDVLVSRKGKKAKKNNYEENEEGRVSFRSSLQVLIGCIGEFKDFINENHKKLISSTPFGKLFMSIYNGRITNNEADKATENIIQIMDTFNVQSRHFRIGEKSIRMTSMDIALLFGLPNVGDDLPKEDFDHNNSTFIKTYFNMRKKVTKKDILNRMHEVVRKEQREENDEVDFVRLMILYILSTVFYANAPGTLPWHIIPAVLELSEISRFDWAKDIHSDTMEKLSKYGSTTCISGCSIAILYWFCERVRIIEQTKGKEDELPRVARWDLQKLRRNLRGLNLNTLLNGVVLDEARAISDEERNLFSLHPIEEKGKGQSVARLMTNRELNEELIATKENLRKIMVQMELMKELVDKQNEQIAMLTEYVNQLVNKIGVQGEMEKENIERSGD